MTATAGAGRPTVRRNRRTASERRSASTSASIRSRRSAGRGGWLSSTMKGASYTASRVIPSSRDAASNASAAPEDCPKTCADPPAAATTTRQVLDLAVDGVTAGGVAAVAATAPVVGDDGEAVRERRGEGSRGSVRPPAQRAVHEDESRPRPVAS